MRRCSRLAVLLATAAGLLGCLGEPAARPPAWELPLPAIRDEPILEADRLHRTRLENGLTVLVLEDPELPQMGLSVTLRRGAGGVPSESAGLAAFTAELLERGAGGRDALALAEAVDALGASLTADAGWDAMSVSVSGLSRDLDSLLEILADVVLRPRFDPEESVKVRDEFLAAHALAKDSPGTLARWHLARVLYPEHPYGLPLEGTEQTLSRLDAAAARTYHQQVFAASNAIFSAWGDVDTSELLLRVRALFGSWPAGVMPPRGTAPPSLTPQARRIVVVDKPDRGQAQIMVGHEGITRTDPERIAASLMNTALGGGGFTSRLMTRVRAEEGLTYSVYSAFSLRRHPGPFVISTFTRVPEVRRVIDLLLAEMERMRAEPPEAEEFLRIQTLSAGRFALGLETSAAIANALTELDVAGLPEDSLDTYRGRVRDQTAADVARAARKRLHPERAAIVVVGPAEAIRAQLEDLGPVEVVEP